MTSTLELGCGPVRCALRPDLGGSIAGLWFGALPVLRSTEGDALTTSRLAGSYPLVPFSNRVAKARLKWQGTSHPLMQHNAAEPHAIHGVGWQRPWTVLESDARNALLAYEHRADASWPFAFDASQTFRVSDDTLELTLSLTNQSGEPAPAGLGWHPYFTKRARSHVAFEATGRWEMGPDKLPTHRSLSRGLDADCASLDVDHCFDGWTGTVHLRDEQLHVQISANLSRLVVFTNGTRDFVAIEPVSHVNNAVNRMASDGTPAEDLGVHVLAPGESVSAHMSIQMEKMS